MTQSFTAGHQNIQMAWYIFLHATQLLALLLFSTNINDYSLCGDPQLDTENPVLTHQQSVWHVIGSSSLHDSCHHLDSYLTTCPQCIFLTLGLSSPESPKPSNMHFFPLHYYASSSLHIYLPGGSDHNKIATYMGQ